MTNQCKFKEGDRVKKVNGRDFSNGEFVVTVEGMEEDYGGVWLKETQSWLDKDSLCLVQPFTKSDLKDGMVVTYRDSYSSNNLKRVVFKGSLYRILDDGMSMQHGVYLKYYSDTLEYDNDGDMDIMKVTYMGEILWEREEESEEDKKIKEIINWVTETLEECRSSGLFFDIDETRKIKEELNKLL